MEATPGFTINNDPDLRDISVFTAVQEQLGLRLEAQKAMVEVLVVHHVEKPSENKRLREHGKRQAAVRQVLGQCTNVAVCNSYRPWNEVVRWLKTCATSSSNEECRLPLICATRSFMMEPAGSVITR